MKLVLMSKQYWAIVCGVEISNADSTVEARLEFLYRSQNAVSIITMVINDHFLDATTGTADPAALWIQLRDKYHVSVEATFVALLTEYHVVSIKDDESDTQYFDRVRSLEKRLHAAGKVYKYEDKMKTMVRDVLTHYTMTRDLLRELSKLHHEAVAILVAKEAKLKPSGAMVRKGLLYLA